MKNLFSGLASAVMVVYTLYRAFTTLVFLPFAGSLGSPTGVYFLLLVLLAAGATSLSFTKQKGFTALIALSLGFAAVIYWWVFICRSSIPVWSDFYWLVIPELCFACAGIGKWAVLRSEVHPLQTQPRAI